MHFIGDVHQPLHLTDRERGGNDDPVRFEGRRFNLHSVWDGALLTKAIREQHNYTEPLPARQIEDSLQGAIYDPYIRLLLWEGVRVWWRPYLASWFECPSPFDSKALASSSQQLLFAGVPLQDDAGKIPPVTSVVCPSHWADWTHQITCGKTFPAGLTGKEVPPVELNTKEYYGPIRDGNVIEELLVRAGLRLAATLNAILADEDELMSTSMFAWLDEADALAAQEAQEA